MKHFLLATSLLLTANFSLTAQTCTPFSGACNTAQYTVLGPQETSNLATGEYVLPQPSKLYKTDGATGALTQIGTGNMGLHVNALAYNPSDNFLYGMVDSTVFDRANLNFTQASFLYRIGEGACMQRMGPVLAPAANPAAYARGVFSFVGDMDKAGNYYFPAIVVNTLDVATSVVSYDLYLGKIAAADFAAPKLGGYTPTYSLVDRNSCTAIMDRYVLQYCLAVIQGQPRPNGALQDWAYNTDDNTLWAYMATDKKFFRLPTIDAGVGLTAFCEDAPITFSDLPTTELGGFIFDNSQNLYAIDPENGRYYGFTNCAATQCATLDFIREYQQDFEPITNPTFRNLRGDMAACALRTPITPTDQPFTCHTARLAVLSEQDRADGAGTYQYAGKSQLYIIDESVGSLIQLSNKPMAQHLDGLAIHPTTKFAYALSDSLRSEAGMTFMQDAVMQRIDNAGFTRPWFAVETPDALAGEKAIVLTQAGEMDRDGNYYVPAVVLNATQTTAPYVTSYTLYVGVIPSVNFTNAASASVKPNYLSVTIAPTCNTIFNDYVERLVASVIERGNRPLSGVQDWSYDAPSNSLISYLGIERSLVRFALPAGNTGIVEASCEAVASAPVNANASMGGQFLGLADKIYAIDTQNGIYYTIAECTTATGCTDVTPILTYTDAFSATKPNFTGLTGDVASCPLRTNPTLPVELARFVGSANKCEVSLRWITNSEKNNARFEVQRSTNGSDFATITTVIGNGTTNLLHAYEYTDQVAGKRNYYRLKQIDFDGTINYPGSVISVNANCNISGNVGVVSVFPNPTLNTAKISFNATKEEVGNANWTLTDVTGRIVAQKSQFINIDNNLLELDLTDFANGVYVFRMQGENWSSEASRIVKMSTK
jgi:Secretion system C-terminal sorting domain